MPAGTTGVSPVAATLCGEAISFAAERRREVAGAVLFERRLHGVLAVGETCQMLLFNRAVVAAAPVARAMR